MRPTIHCLLFVGVFLGSIGAFIDTGHAVVHTGMDSVAVFEGFDFTDPLSLDRKYLIDPFVDDIEVYQVQDRHSQTVVGGGVINALPGILDLGPLPFDELISVPQEIEPDSSITAAPLHESHLYLLRTHEGYLAKFRIEEILSIDETHPEIYSKEWNRWVSRLIIRWAYQDDGSRSFDTETNVDYTTWGVLKLIPLH